MTVVFDGVHMAHPVAFPIAQPQLVRRYQLLAMPATYAEDYWFTVSQLFVASDRAIGIALDGMTAQLTSLIID